MLFSLKLLILASIIKISSLNLLFLPTSSVSFLLSTPMHNNKMKMFYGNIIINDNDRIMKNCLPLLSNESENVNNITAAQQIRWGLKKICWGLIHITVPRVRNNLLSLTVFVHTLYIHLTISYLFLRTNIIVASVLFVLRVGLCFKGFDYLF